jgi:hypothetical protein
VRDYEDVGYKLKIRRRGETERMLLFDAEWMDITCATKRDGNTINPTFSQVSAPAFVARWAARFSRDGLAGLYPPPSESDAPGPSIGKTVTEPSANADERRERVWRNEKDRGHSSG